MNDETTPRPPSGNSIERDPHPEPRGRLSLGTPPMFGRYETWRVLGSGAFGRVYLAHDSLMGRYVAIKSPKEPLPPDAHRAFLREARMIADIHHPNICPVHDVGVQDDMPYIVMRYVSGGTLNDLISREPLTPNQALRFAEQIANGLEEAHANGIFHRDLKPANVLYDEKAAKLLLTDFGIARWADATQTIGGTPGTPQYMAPEQWGQNGPFGNISARTDVYSLGVVLFLLLTGTRLFDGNQYELMAHHCQTPPRPPSAVRPDLDTQIDELCLKALAKQQDERYGSAKEFADAIADYLRPAAMHRTRWQITVPGEWYSRRAGWDINNEVDWADVKNHRHERQDGEDESEFWRKELIESDGWKKVTNTPADVTCNGDEVYLLSIAEDASDESLAELIHLNSLRSLHALELRRVNITDVRLGYLRTLSSLRCLELCACDEITDVGIAHLRSLTNLQDLGLSNGQFTDEGLLLLTRLTELRFLNISLCGQITDGGLLHLKLLTNLEYLELSGCEQITDAGLLHLKSLNNLGSLDLYGCSQITKAGIAELKRVLPNCVIEWSLTFPTA